MKSPDESRILRDGSDTETSAIPEAAPSAHKAGDTPPDIEQLKSEIERQRHELQKAREEARFFRERLALLFNKSPNGCALLDRHGLILDANETFSQMLGKERNLLVGRPFHLLLSPIDQGPFLARFNALFRGSGTKTINGAMTTSQGKHLHVRIHASALDSPLKPSGDKEPQLLFSIRDITEQKRIEEEKDESRAVLQQIIDFLPDATFVIDKEGRVIAWNRAIERMTGKKAREMLGKGNYEYSLAFYEERRPVLIDLVNNPDEETFSKYEYVRREGDTLVSETSSSRLILGDRELLNTACPIYDKKGKVIGAIECIRDITRQKRAEDALIESEERFRVAFYASPDAVSITCLEDGAWIDINEGFTMLTGYTREEVIGKTDAEVSPWQEPGDWKRLLDEVGEKGSCENREILFRRKDGTIGASLVSARTIRIKGIPHVLAITRDITAMRDAENEKQRLQAQLSQAQKMESVGRLAGGIAHDFNNMLSVILGRAELALARLPPEDPLARDLADIEKAARRSADLTRRLLAFARKQTAFPRVIDLNETITGMLKMIRRLIGENIALDWLPGHGCLRVKVDPAQVDQILANLCVNAKDAIADVGRIVIKTEGVIIDEDYCRNSPSAKPGRYVMLEVSDTGCGMDREVMERIFEPFFTTKELGKGTGLGLATVYGIVKQNEGFINVYSELGSGTTFRIYFAAHEEDPLDKGLEPQDPDIKGGNEVILLVEDEPMLLEMGRMMLSKLGYRVIATSSPVEALEIAARGEKELDLVVTDLIMPEMNGKDLAAMILAIRPEVRCLFTSGYTADVIAHHGVLEEGVNFIQKPFALRDLSCKVREALETRR